MPGLFFGLVFALSLFAGVAWCADARKKPVPRGNLFANPLDASAAEMFEDLLVMPGSGDVTIERIFSEGQASPEGFWLDQEWDEWVMLVAGGAELELLDSGEILKMAAGDWARLPAHCVHRVKSTEKGSLWLAIHVGRPPQCRPENPLD